MKILVLAPHPFFQNRGTPIALRMVLETLAGDGHQLAVLVYPEGEELQLANCRIIRLPLLRFATNVKPGFSWKKLLYDAKMFRVVGRLLRQERFDLIHAGEEAVFIARYYSKRLGIPYVYDMDSSLPQQLSEKLPLVKPLLPVLTRLERLAVADSSGVLAVCPYLRDLALQHSPTTTVQLLEDVTLLPERESEEECANTDLGLPPGPTTFMYVGNLERYQGLDLLLSAFSLACLEPGVALRLVIIGGTKGDIARYRKMAKKLGIHDQVLFAGPKPVAQLGCYLRQAEVVVSPRIKGFNTPMKIYSYMDCGRPLLATRLETHTQVLDDSLACLVEADDRAMAESILLLARDPELRATLAEQSRQRVQQRYTRQAFAEKLRAFYRQIGGQPGFPKQEQQ